MRRLEWFRQDLNVLDEKYVPLYVTRSLVHARITISTASRKRSWLSSIGTPKVRNSRASKPRPAPQLTRPPLSTSSRAISSARRSG